MVTHELFIQLRHRVGDLVLQFRQHGEGFLHGLALLELSAITNRQGLGLGLGSSVGVAEWVSEGLLYFLLQLVFCILVCGVGFEFLDASFLCGEFFVVRGFFLDQALDGGGGDGELGGRCHGGGLR